MGWVCKNCGTLNMRKSKVCCVCNLKKPITDKKVWKILCIVVFSIILFVSLLLWNFGNQQQNEVKGGVYCTLINNGRGNINIRENCSKTSCTNNHTTLKFKLPEQTLVKIDSTRDSILDDKYKWVPVIYENKEYYVASNKLKC